MEENFTNIIVDNSEILLDSLITNEILKEIPVIGTSIKLIKGVNNIRDQIYLNKIKYFLKNVGELTVSQKKRLIKESKKDSKRRTKFGESLFTTIEQADSLTKIEYLAITFEAFLNSDIDDKELRHICHAINRCFIDDLVEIVEADFPNYEILKSNVDTGLASSLEGGITANLMGGNVTYTISFLGEKFRKIWNKYS